jgi:hypothetical protein
VKRVRWSKLKEMAKSPAHYRYALDHPRPDSPSLLLGRAFHCLLFEPRSYAKRFVVSDLNKNSNAWKEFKAAHEGFDFLTSEQETTAKRMAEQVMGHPRACVLFTGGKAEFEIEWTYKARIGSEKYEIPCGARPDYWGPAGLVDLKSTVRAGPMDFGREVVRYGYHGQSAFYTDGLLASGLKVEAQWIVAIENEAPHEVAVYRLPPDVVTLGRERYFLLMDRLWRCEQAKDWPAWPGENLLTLPAWASNEDAIG